MTLEMFGALNGETAIGFHRTDVPMVHVIAQGPPGIAFEVRTHFAACAVCKAHGVTEADFHSYMTVAQ